MKKNCRLCVPFGNGQRKTPHQLIPIILFFVGLIVFQNVTGRRDKLRLLLAGDERALHLKVVK